MKLADELAKIWNFEHEVLYSEEDNCVIRAIYPNSTRIHCSVHFRSQTHGIRVIEFQPDIYVLDRPTKENVIKDLKEISQDKISDGCLDFIRNYAG